MENSRILIIVSKYGRILIMGGLLEDSNYGRILNMGVFIGFSK